MRQQRGPLYQMLAEQIVVLRDIPQCDQDDSITGDYTYCDCTYPIRKYKKLFLNPHDLQVTIQQDAATLDPDGIVVLELDYICQIVPPFSGIQSGDLVIRIEKDCQELYVSGITQELGRQVIELENRSKTEPQRY